MHMHMLHGEGSVCGKWQRRDCLAYYHNKCKTKFLEMKKGNRKS